MRKKKSEQKITNWDVIEGTRNNFIYATFAGTEIEVIAKLPANKTLSNGDELIGLNRSQARDWLQTKIKITKLD